MAPYAGAMNLLIRIGVNAAALAAAAWLLDGIRITDDNRVLTLVGVAVVFGDRCGRTGRCVAHEVWRCLIVRCTLSRTSDFSLIVHYLRVAIPAMRED